MVGEAVESPRRLLYPVMRNALRKGALEKRPGLASGCVGARKHVLVLTKALGCCYALLLGSARGDSSHNFPLLFLLPWLSVLMERLAILAAPRM